ncbi:hypothetical protein HDU85_000151 [Gaertneriomyces sp. JEL0708]|nr:hypothetical protein HDU85_000151 [Gaertneriomyces sp. JEL0708]
MVCLTLSDGSINALQLGPTITQLVRGGWDMSERWCQFQGFTTNLAAMISYHMLVLLTLERLTTIVRAKTWGKSHTITGLAWSTFISVLICTGYTVGGNAYALQEVGTYCAADYVAVLRPQKSPRILKAFSAVLVVITVLMLLLVTYAYMAIYWTVHGAVQDLRHVLMDGAMCSPAQPADEQGLSASRASGLFTRSRSKKADEAPQADQARITRFNAAVAFKCGVLLSVFVCTYFPTIIKIVWTWLRMAPISREYDAFTAMIIISSGVVNPLCALLLDARWRGPAAELLGKMCKRDKILVSTPAAAATK